MEKPASMKIAKTNYRKSKKPGYKEDYEEGFNRGKEKFEEMSNNENFISNIEKWISLEKSTKACGLSDAYFQYSFDDGGHPGQVGTIEGFSEAHKSYFESKGPLT